MNKNWKIIGISSIIGVGLGILAYKIFKEFKDIDFEKSLDSELDDDEIYEKIPKERSYVSIPLEKITKNFFKEKKSEEAVSNINIEDGHELNLRKDEDNSIYFDEFFEAKIFTEYKDVINEIVEEDSASLLFAKNYNIFYSGDFNISELKRVFTEEYSKIKNLLATDNPAFGVVPIEMKSLECFLDEIDELSDLEDVKGRVLGLLSYWVLIGQAINKYPA